MPPPDADFAFTINFEKGSGDPRRIFDAASLLIDGFEELDEAVASAVDNKIKTLVVLEGRFGRCDPCPKAKEREDRARVVGPY